MGLSSFFKQMGIATAIAILIGLGFEFIPKTQPINIISWASIAFFCLLNIGTYFIAQEVKKSKKEGDFISFIMGLSAGRMILSGVFIFVYDLLVEPGSILIVIPFFVMYTLYTIFEIIFLIKLSKAK